MNNMTLKSLANLTKSPERRNDKLMSHIADQLVSQGDNEIKRLIRDTISDESETLVLGEHDHQLLKRLIA